MRSFLATRTPLRDALSVLILPPITRPRRDPLIAILPSPSRKSLIPPPIPRSVPQPQRPLLSKLIPIQLPRRIGQMAMLVAQRRVVTPVGDERDGQSEGGSDEDVLPVVSVIHRSGDGDHDPAEERGEGEPGAGLVAAGGEEVEFAGEVEGEDTHAGEGEGGWKRGEITEG